jgi:NAD+ kinase
MIRTVAITIRPDDRKSIQLIRELISFFKTRGINVLLSGSEILEEEKLSAYICSPEEFVKSPDLIIVIGGDGTFLRVARQFSETGKPIFGINRGRMGFLTEFSPDEAIANLNGIIEGDYHVTERSMLEAVHFRNHNENEQVVFLNDAVISKGAFSRPIQLQLEIDDDFLNLYAGDGLIIATPTGSTAYSLSAGGPIVTPSVENVYIINPVCPHMLGIRPMIVSTSKTLRARVIANFENLLLTIDGQVAIQIEGNDEILFKESKRKIHLITHPRKSYYDILRQKLGWGKNLDE